MKIQYTEDMLDVFKEYKAKKAAVLMDSHTPWDKMITFKLSELSEQTEGFLYYPPKKQK